ncbi:MAG: restriction endonuclease [Nitrososphaerales archaeon]|nr:restriction endonuclease [Nitrososphaerales archaeon]
MDLVADLTRLTGSEQDASSLLNLTAVELGVAPDFASRALVALALCRGGRRPEAVSASLSWREFESFCASLLKASGFEVTGNVSVRRPRAQIDVVAFGPSLILAVDCKHWRRESPHSALARFASAQLKRNALLRRTLSDPRPMVSAIVTLAEQRERFVDGVAVVPLHTLRSFLGSVEGHMDSLAVL